jgi:hypothetical protein
MLDAILLEGGEGLAEKAFGGELVAEPERVGLERLALGGELEAGGGLEEAGDEQPLEGVARCPVVPERGEVGERAFAQPGGQGQRGEELGDGHQGRASAALVSAIGMIVGSDTRIIRVVEPAYR